MMRESLVHQSRRTLKPAAAILLCAFLLWEAGVVVRAHGAANRGTRAAVALGSLHALRAELDRLQENTGLPAGMPEGDRSTQDPFPAARRPPAGGRALEGGHPPFGGHAEAAVRYYFRHDRAALHALDETAALRLRAKEMARVAFLRRVDRPLPSTASSTDPPMPGLPEVHRDLSEASEQIEQLETRCVFDLRLAAEEAGGGRLALTASFGVILALFALSLHTERVRRHYQRGARLVEDMLEAYSRRLEAMNVQLEQVNLLKTQFLANTSHELLTPLNGVIGSLEVIRSGSCASAEEERSFLDQAYHSAERLFGLIRDLCHMEEGNLALRCRQMEFRSVLERELAAHRSALAARGLVLLVTPPSDDWPRIAGDPGRVTQVLRHLLANAVKFTEHGSLRVTGRIEQGPRPFLRVEVADTGVGIEPGKLGQVFDLFSQADGSNTRRFGGAGLGLTLSRHLVQGMGGQIGIESDGPGRGTRAWFTLPLDAGGLPPDTAAEFPKGHSRAA
jgi:signal transduction histidine kinase